MKRAILLASAVVAACLCGAALNVLYSRIKLDRQFAALSRYQLEPTPEIAIVGSSMSFRIPEEFFRTPLRNISISGGSPLTGLAIIASYEKVPKLVLVEANLIARPLDGALVQSFGISGVTNLSIPARVGVSYAYRWLKKNHDTEIAEGLLKIDPADYDISQSIADDSASLNRSDWAVFMQPNIEELRILVFDLERRGSRVVLFELPSPPVVRNTPLVLTDRQLTRSAFPDPRQWISIQDPHEQLRWVDASHFDMRSAMLVARQIDVRINDLKDH